MEEFIGWLIPVGTILFVPAFWYWNDKRYLKRADYNKESKEFRLRVDEEIARLATTMQTMIGKAESDHDSIVELETKIQLFWRSLEKRMGDILHRDDTPNIDRLLEKLPGENLTSTERRELTQYLELIQASDRSKDDKVAAMILQASIESRFLHDP